MTKDLEILGMSAANALHTPNIPLYALLTLLPCKEHNIFLVILTVISANGVQIREQKCHKTNLRWAPECQMPALILRLLHFLQKQVAFLAFL